MNRFDCNLSRLSRTSDEIRRISDTQFGRLSTLGPAYFDFQGLPKLPEVFKMPKPGFLSEILKNGIPNGEIHHICSELQIRHQLMPVLMYIRYFTMRLTKIDDFFEEHFGFPKPNHGQYREGFYYDFIGNCNVDDQTGKDTLIRQLINYIQELLAEKTEEFGPKFERKFS